MGVDVVIASRRRSDGTLTPHYTNTVFKPTPTSNQPERLRLPVALANVAVLPGDELLLTHRGQSSTGPQWVNVYDRLYILPSAATRYATVTITVGANAVPVAQAHPAASALRFDGNDDYVRFGETFTGFPAGDLTVEFWMKSSDTTKAGSVISYSVPGQDNEFLLFDYRNFDLYVGGASRSLGVGGVAGQWRHVAISRSFEDGLTQVYLDGVLAATVTVAPGVGFRDGGILVLGQDQDSSGGGFETSQAFWGDLDEVRIWNRVRTGEEIETNRWVRASGTESGLVASWSFNEAPGLNVANAVPGGVAGTLGYGNADQAPLRTPDYAPFDTVYQTPEDTAIPVTLSGTDADNDPLTAIVTDLPAHGTLHQTADGATISGPLGGPRARRFDGSNDLITIPENPAGNLSGQPQWTITAWIRPRSARQSYPVIYAEGKWRVSLGLQAGTGRLDSWVNDSAQVLSDRPVTFGEWQHVAITSSDTARTFYINGQPAGSGSAPAVAPDSTGAAIGGVIAEVGNARNRFEGDIDEVALWDRALSPAELAELTARPLTGGEPGLMAWWPLDEASGTVVADATGRGSDGVAGGGIAERVPGFTLNSSPAFAATLPRVTHPERKLIYMPDDEWSGLDQFAYRVNDGKVDSADALLYVRTLNVNDPPVAAPDTVFAVAGFAQVISNVLANDFDAEGDGITLLDFTLPAHGTLESHGDGTFLYRANNGFAGADSFTYRATDGASPSTPATVTIHVAAPAQFRWVNVAGGNWGDPANWSANRVPTAEDDVFIDEPGTYTVTVNVEATARRIVLGGGSGTQTLALANRTLTVWNDSFVRPNGIFSQTGGTLDATEGGWTVDGGYHWTGGVLRGEGTTEWTAPASVTLGVPTADLYLDDGRRLLNGAEVLVTARRLYLRNAQVAGATLENRGTLTFAGEADLEWSNSSSSRPVYFINAGTVQKIGAGTSAVEVPLTGTGSIQVAEGTLRFSGGGSQSGPVHIAAGATFELASGGFVLSGGGVVDGDGLLQLTSGSLALENDQTWARFAQTGGDLRGPGGLSVTHEFQWTNGRQLGNAVTELAAAAVGNLSGGGGVKQLVAGRRLVNRATLTVSGNWIYLDNDNVGGAGIENHGTLHFDQAAGVHQTSGNANNPTLIDNRGILNISADPNNSEGTRFRPPFQNSGAIRVQRGQFVLERSSTQTGSLSVTNDAAMSFAAGDHLFTAESRISGSGTFYNVFGSLTISSRMDWTGLIRFTAGSILFNADQTFRDFVQGQENGASATGGSGVVTITNTFTWNGGTIGGAGRFEIAPTATATLGGGNKVIAGGMTVVNRTTMTLGGGNLFLANSGDQPTRFENRGTFVISGGEGVSYTGWDGVKPMVFANFGTFVKQGANTTSLVDVPFDNAGVLDIQGGTLRWNRDGTHSGTILISQDAALQISAGTHRVNEGFQFAGQGSVSVTGGELALNTPLNFGALQVAFGGNAAISGPFPVSNDSGGELIVDGNLTFPGDVFIGGALRIAAANRTVTVAGSLTLATTGTLENPGTLLVGAFDDQGGAVVGNPPTITGNPIPGTTVVITAILRGGGDVEPSNSQGEPSLILRWQAPTAWGYQLEASSDLETWRPLPGEPIVLAAQRFETRIPLPEERVRYFRVRWNGAPSSPEH
ncbi:MAG: cadherin-like domain-containing protein [Verrucomicrobiae bacterium]|nr:cadherin-like domain-containing protein [Verrucomicrobiae bacterium]